MDPTGKEINTGSSVLLHYRTYPLKYKKTLGVHTITILWEKQLKRDFGGSTLLGTYHILISHLWKKEKSSSGLVCWVVGYDSMGIPGIANWAFCMLQLSLPRKRNQKNNHRSPGGFSFWSIRGIHGSNQSPGSGSVNIYICFPMKKLPPRNLTARYLAFPEFNHRLGPRQALHLLGSGKAGR